MRFLRRGAPSWRPFGMLEPSEGKLSRSVLRGVRGRKAPDLPGISMSDFALYLNGVYDKVFHDIVKAQTSNPGLVCYLQPYASEKIVKLAESTPSTEFPVTLYVSLTSSLPVISYRGEIVGWEDKRELSKARLAKLNSHIRKHQPREKEVYLRAATGKTAVNLIAVVNMERLDNPVPVTALVKLSDGEPLKPRIRSGNWAYVQEVPDWNEVMLETVLEQQLKKELV